MQSRSLIASLMVVIGVVLITVGLGEFFSTLLYALIDSPDGPRSEESLRQLFLRSSIPLVLTAVLGASLILLRSRIGDWFGSREESGTLNTSSLVNVGVTLIGVWYLARGVEGILDLLQLRLIYGEVPLEYYRVGLAHLVVGVLLLLASRVLPRLRKSTKNCNAA